MQEFGERRYHRLDFLAGVCVAGEKDHALARQHHARRAGDLAIDEGGALRGERRDLPLLDRNRIGAELDHDLARPCRAHQPVGTLHDFFKRRVGRQAGEDDVRLGADFGRGTRRHAADLLELLERAAAVADDAIAVFNEVLRDRHSDLADADKADCLRPRSSQATSID